MVMTGTLVKSCYDSDGEKSAILHSVSTFFGFRKIGIVNFVSAKTEKRYRKPNNLISTMTQCDSFVFKT